MLSGRVEGSLPPKKGDPDRKVASACATMVGYTSVASTFSRHLPVGCLPLHVLSDLFVVQSNGDVYHCVQALDCV